MGDSRDAKSPLDWDSALKAFEQSLHVVPIPHEFMTLDCDNGIEYDALKRDGIDDSDMLVLPSKSGMECHFHVLIDVRRFEHIYFKMDMLQRAFLAVSFGSDPVREYMSASRNLSRYPYPWKLFMTTEAYAKSFSWATLRNVPLFAVTEKKYREDVEQFFQPKQAELKAVEDFEDLPW